MRCDGPLQTFVNGFLCLIHSNRKPRKPPFSTCKQRRTGHSSRQYLNTQSRNYGVVFFSQSSGLVGQKMLGRNCKNIRAQHEHVQTIMHEFVDGNYLTA